MKGKWIPFDTKQFFSALPPGMGFNITGEITGLYTPGRYREIGGEYELTPWAGNHHGYEENDGLRIPVEGEVEWQPSSGRLPYCKLEIGRACHTVRRPRRRQSLRRRRRLRP